jgi:hypothetical protein
MAQLPRIYPRARACPSSTPAPPTPLSKRTCGALTNAKSARRATSSSPPPSVRQGWGAGTATPPRTTRASVAVAAAVAAAVALLESHRGFAVEASPRPGPGPRAPPWQRGGGPHDCGPGRCARKKHAPAPSTNGNGRGPQRPRIDRGGGGLKTNRAPALLRRAGGGGGGGG